MADSATNTPTVGGVVLAGGRSSRMGRDKATLDWHGTPLVVRVATRLRAITDGPVVVVAAPGQVLPPLPAGIETAVDPEPDRGPLMGLIAGLAHLQGRAGQACVVATDQPFVDAAVFAPLLGPAGDGDAAVFAQLLGPAGDGGPADRHVEPAGTDAPAGGRPPGPAAAAWTAAPDGRLQPLGAVYAVDACLQAARDRIDEDPSLKGLLQAVGAQTRPADARTTAALRSLDTPAAYAKALALSRS